MSGKQNKTTWTKEAIIEALRESQFGDAFTELNELAARRFRAFGRENGLEVVVDADGKKFRATVKGRY